MLLSQYNKTVRGKERISIRIPILQSYESELTFYIFYGIIKYKHFLTEKGRAT